MEQTETNKVRDIIAHCLLMGMGAYPSPEDFAEAILKRLKHDGYTVVQQDQVIGHAGRA